MAESINNKVLMFREIPTEWPEIGKHIVLETQKFSESDVPDNGATTRNLYTSFDPYMRGKMRDEKIKSYSAAYPLNSPVSARTIARVLRSSNDKFKKGDIIITDDTMPIAEFAAMTPAMIEKARKLDVPEGFDPINFLGPAGATGLTAYSSLYEIGKPKKGETIFISSAAGAVGQVVGQIAKREGLKVYGSVGDDDKLDFIINECGYDGGFNYKKEKPKDALKRLCPDGIDIYYENVGGEQLQAAFDALNFFGRIVVCGMISQYNLKPADQIPLRNITTIVSKRITMQGFIVMDADFGPKYGKEFMEKMVPWIMKGEIKLKTHIDEGMDNAATGLLGVFKGQNFGKSVLKIQDDVHVENGEKK